MTEEVATNPDVEVASEDTSIEDVNESHDDQADEESEVETAETAEAESEVEEVDWEGKSVPRASGDEPYAGTGPGCQPTRSVPRASGDEPVKLVQRRPLLRCSPRERG